VACAGGGGHIVETEWVLVAVKSERRKRKQAVALQRIKATNVLRRQLQKKVHWGVVVKSG